MSKSFTLAIAGTIACWLLPFIAWSQGYVPQIIPPSPSAAAMAKYGEIPVSTYTGIPTIEIPLYQIRSGSLTVPVSLSYHASGNKVEDISSNVGLGWTLAATGSISRSVRGLPDEAPNGYFNFFPEDPNSLSDGDLRELAKSNRDGQTDLFYFSFGQYSGKIIFDGEGNCYILPQQKFKIKPGIGPKKDILNRWVITAENGTSYVFDKVEISSSDRYNFGGSSVTAPLGGMADYPSSWYLSEISSPGQRDRITFQYSTETIKRDRIITYTKYNNSTSTSYVDTETKALRLASIDFPEGKIEISATQAPPGSPFPVLLPDREDLANSYKIKEIKVTNLYGNLIKKIKLQHSYFSAGCSEPICKRLKLDAVIEQGSDGTPSKPYLFEYNTEPLPRRNSYDYDHWGYYNKRGNTVPIPEYQVYDAAKKDVTFYEGADRRPDPAAAQAGILKKITYPTGGTSYFEYQLNEVIADELPNKTSGDPIPYSIRGNATNPNNSVSFTVQGYQLPGQVVKVRYRITGCTPSSPEPDNGGGFEGPSYPDLCAHIVIEKDGRNISSFAYYSSEEEQEFPMYLPNGRYVLKGMNAAGDQTYFAELKIDREVNSPNKYAGGLRIARIINYDDYNPAGNSVKEYQYNENNLSTGRLSNYPVYQYWMQSIKCTTAGTSTVVTNTPTLVRTQTSNATLGNERGSFVGYGKVTELHGLLGANGKSEYVYTSIHLGEQEPGTSNNPYADQNRNTFPFGPAVVSNDWKRGLLKKKTDYQFAGNENEGFKPVKEVINDYGTLGNGTSVPGVVIGNRIINACEVEYFSYEGAHFRERMDVSFVLTKSTEHVFDQRGSNRNTSFTEYEYSTTHLQPLVVSNTLSSSWKVTTRFKYPSDYNNLVAHSGEMATALNAMVNTHHIHHLPIEKQTWEEKDGETLLTNAEILTYKPNGLDADGVFHLKTSVPQNNIAGDENQYVPSEIDAAGKFVYQEKKFQRMVHFNNYNSAGKILDFTKADGISQAYIWGYSGTLPVAQVINASADQVAYTGFENHTTGNWAYTIGASGDAFKGDYFYSGAVATAKPIPAGEYQVTFVAKGTGTVIVQGNSVNVSGDWKEYKKTFRLPSQGIVTVNAGGVAMDELRLCPAGGQMTIFDYKPSIGITASTDLNGVSAYFEYDGLNRLRTVRDDDRNIVKNYRYNVAGSIQPLTEQNSLTADFRVDGMAKAGSGLLFTAAATQAGLKYYWDFGDGTIAANSGNQPSHSYNRAGTYVVKLTVSSAEAYKSSAQWLTIKPADPPPPPVGDGPAPVVTNITLSNAHQALKIDRSQSRDGITLLIPYREVTLDATVTVGDGVGPYLAYEWILDRSSSLPTGAGTATTTSPNAYLTATDYQETEAVRYYVKCRAKGSNNRYSDWFMVYIDFPSLNNP